MAPTIEKQKTLNDQAECERIAKFLARHGNPCPSFHVAAELGLSNVRAMKLLPLVARQEERWGFWVVN